MVRVDWDAYIINQTLGTDVATSLAGSIVEEQEGEPKVPARPLPRSKIVLIWIAAIAGLIAAVVIHSALR
jgi:hypothetical protein